MYRHQRHTHCSLQALFHTTRAYNHEAACVYTALTQPSRNPAPALGLQTNVEELGLRPCLQKAMATVSSGPPSSLQDEVVGMSVVGLGQGTRQDFSI